LRTVAVAHSATRPGKTKTKYRIIFEDVSYYAHEVVAATFEEALEIAEGRMEDGDWPEWDVDCPRYFRHEIVGEVDD
jgi:hypothetical protein